MIFDTGDPISDQIVKKLLLSQLDFVVQRQNYFGDKMANPNISKEEFQKYKKNCQAIYAENRELIEDDGSGEICLTFVSIDLDR